MNQLEVVRATLKATHINYEEKKVDWGVTARIIKTIGQTYDDTFFFDMQGNLISHREPGMEDTPLIRVSKVIFNKTCEQIFKFEELPRWQQKFYCDIANEVYNIILRQNHEMTRTGAV